MIPILIEAALRSVLLAAAVWVGLRAFRVRNVVVQKMAWAMVLAGAALMPVLAPSIAGILPAKLGLVLPRYSAAASAPVEPVAATPLHLQSALEAPISNYPKPVGKREHYFSKPLASAEAAPSLNTRAMEVAVGGSAAAPEERPATRNFPALSVAVAVRFGYVIIACVLLVRLLYGLACAIYLYFSADRVVQSEGVDYAGTVWLRASSRVASPVTIGSAVVLPTSYKQWDPEKLRVVLAHERSHIRQGDFYLQLCAGLYAALVWFSPLGWWLKRELSDLAETISDRAGVEQAASSASYAQILLEFAAMPRPTILGVAMARSGSLSRRVERLLNDKAFGQAFAGGGRRALVGVVLVPLALLATTAMVRVQAAQDAQASTPAEAPTGPNAPTAAIAAARAVLVSSQAAPAQAAPAAKPSPAQIASAPDASVRVSDDEGDGSVVVTPRVIVIPRIPQVGPIPPVPAISVDVPKIPPVPPVTVKIPKIAIPVLPPMPVVRVEGVFAMAQRGESGKSGYRYVYSENGQSYAVVHGDRRESMNFSGDVHTDAIDKARQMAHGDFLWFNRDGKSYFVDDASTLAQIEAMYKPMEELGKKQEELGSQQEELGRQQEALGRQQEEASLPAPDVQKEIAEIDAAMARLKAKMGQNVTSDELGDLQGKLGDLQGKLGDLQGRIGEKQGQFGAQQGKLGEQQGRLGAEQGKLGAEQGRLGREADLKVRSIIDESLKNGKAHLIQ